MKRYILAISLLLVSGALFAFCPGGDTVGNTGSFAVTGLDPNNANIFAKIWVQGSADWTTFSGTSCAQGTCTGGCDSGNVPYIDTGCNLDGRGLLLDYPCVNGALGTPGALGDYFIWSNWFTGTYDGCPSTAAATRACVLIYDTSGRYTLQSHSKTGNGWGGFDDIGTQTGTVLSAATGSATDSGLTTDITWTALPGAVTDGIYFAGDQPLSPLVTSFNVYTYTGAAAPAVFNTAAWSLLDTGVSTVTAASNYTFANPGVGVGMWLSRSIVIDGFELPFVSTSIIPLYDPSGAPSISGLSAINNGLNTTVNWTSGDESQVTGYQVFFATAGGEYTAVGNRINPAGNNHAYTTSVRIPSTSGFTVKVGAYLTSGNVEYSSPVSVKVTNIIHDKTRVAVD